MQYSAADQELIRRARALVADLTPEDLSLIQVRVPVGDLKKRKPGKSGAFSAAPHAKGGHAPVDFSAVEVLEDLRSVLAVDRPDPEKVIPLFIQLRGLVGG